MKRGEREKRTVIESFDEENQNQSFDKSLIERDWEIISGKISPCDQIDDITWNDLEMDQVYCKINNCKSFAGDQILYSTLHITQHDNESFQKKTEFFTSNISDRNDIWYIISKLGKQSNSYYLPAFINNLEAFKIPNIGYYRFMRVILFLSVIPAIVYFDYTYLTLTFLIALVNVIIYTFQKHRYEPYLNMLGSVLRIMQAAKQISDSRTLGYEKEFHDLGDNVAMFGKLFLKIRKLQFRAVSSLYGDALTLLDSLTFGATLWDFIQYDKVLRELMGHQNELMALYRTIGQIDASIAVASFRKRLPLNCVPEFSREREIIVEDIYHPLLSDPVYNSVTIRQGCLITGSNASGKSTFIKALAINALLAQSICTCMAKRMKLPDCTVITSMAVRDAVLSGESYYIREIRYLKRIIDALNEKKTVLCVVDEILRGTNTEERIAASAAILEYLYGRNCITIVATHDIELTEMLKSHYDNYHFTEYIQDKKILFEYKLHPGPATSRNAVKLLEYMDFPEEIIEAATSGST